MRGHVVVLVRLVEQCHHPHRVVEHHHHVREGIAEEAGDADRHVDARPAELVERDHLEPADPPRRLVPVRPNAQQRQHLGDVVAGGAHRGGAPHRQPDRLGVAAGVVEVALQQRLGHRLAGLPGQPRRHRPRVDGVEVAAGRQHVDQTPQRRAGRAGPHETACQRCNHGVDLTRRAGQPRHHLGRGELAATPARPARRAASSTAPASQPAASIASTKAARAALDLVHRRGLGAVLQPERGRAVPGRRGPCRPTPGRPAGSPAPG